MKNVTQEMLVQFANEIEEMEARKKSLTKDINDYYADFCEENDVKKKALKGAVKLYLQWKKDRSKFLEDVNELDKLVDVLTGEVCIEAITEEQARA